MWYFSPFFCAYDLLQFGLGHLNGFDSSIWLNTERPSVVDARVVRAAELAPAASLFDKEPSPVSDDDACVFCLSANAPGSPEIGETGRDNVGVVLGVPSSLPLGSRAVSGVLSSLPLGSRVVSGVLSSLPLGSWPRLVSPHTTPFLCWLLLWLWCMGASAMP